MSQSPTGKAPPNLPTRQRLARERGAKMLALYESGLSQKQIGVAYGGISQAAVSQILTMYSAYVTRPRKRNGRVEAVESFDDATSQPSEVRTDGRSAA
jgi:predicted transcriptional regulator